MHGKNVLIHVAFLVFRGYPQKANVNNIWTASLLSHVFCNAYIQNRNQPCYYVPESITELTEKTVKFVIKEEVLELTVQWNCG